MPVLVKPSSFRRKSITSAEAGGQRLTGILTDTRFFRLRRAIHVKEYEEEGVWVLECRPLRIHAFGESRKESWRAFIEFFECDWDSIVQQRDARLSLDAQELKRKYQDVVESVEPIL